LGATLIIASRSQKKCDDTAEEINKSFSGDGKAIGKALDVSDLEDVVRFSRWFTANYDHLDILINNAGVSLKDAKSTPENPLQSKQRFDLLFATNYLGHFLLTQLLLPSLLRTPRARVVQVSSTASYLSDGSDLMPGSAGSDHLQTAPSAARVAVLDESHRSRSYANSKLAQLLHSLALQDRINAQSTSDDRLKVPY
jgi:NAD(P)-dependent dehydrogenase (short-subunit alcohol dehydrogenase family)